MKNFRVEGWKVSGWFGIIGLVVGAVYGYLIEDYITSWAVGGMMVGAAAYAILNWIYSIIKKS